MDSTKDMRLILKAETTTWQEAATDCSEPPLACLLVRLLLNHLQKEY